MSLASRLRDRQAAFELKLELDPSKNGGRRSLVWNAAGALDYTSRLKSVGAISMRSEGEDLHSFLTADVSLELSNERTSDAVVYGYWDSATVTADLGANLGAVLGRISFRVQEADGSWPAFTPVFTGLFDFPETANTEGVAHTRLTGFSSVLTAAAGAEDVKNVDSWHQSVSISRAVRLLLTQKDRFVPLYGNNVLGTVAGSSATTITVTRADGANWPADSTGKHPNGVLEGYCVVVTSGPAAGRAYPIKSNTSGTSSSIITVEGNPAGDGVANTHAAIVTGYCWPYLSTWPLTGVDELAGFTIQPVARVPTHDGRRVISQYGRPPEDGTAGVTRALAHDGTRLWLGVDRKLFQYEETTDTYTEVPFTLATNHVWQKFEWDSSTGYVWGWSWAPQQHNTNYHPWGQADIYRFNAASPTPVLRESVSDFYPGDRMVRRGWSPATPDVADTGKDWGKISGLPGQPSIICPFPQEIIWGGPTTPDSFQYGFPADPYSGAPMVDITSSIPRYAEATKTWSYVNLRLFRAAGWDSTWTTTSHIGGKPQLVFLGGHFYYWKFTAAGSLWRLTKYNVSTDTVTTLTAIAAETFGNPTCLWENGTDLFSIFADYGAQEGIPADPPTIQCLRITTAGVTTSRWTSDPSFPWNSVLAVDACGGGGMGGLGCLVMYVPPGYPGSSDGYHQKFLLVKNLEALDFWENFELGTNVVYQSVEPFGHFFRRASDDRAFFVHRGDCTLWHATGGAAGPVSLAPLVPGDKTLASQLCFTPEAEWRVLGVSAGDYVGVAPIAGPRNGRYILWQLAHYFAPRVDVLINEGLSRLEALRQLGELVDFTEAYEPDGDFLFQQRSVSPIDWTLSDDSTLRKVTRRGNGDRIVGRVEARPAVVSLKTPETKFDAAHVDDDGNPIPGEVFNGSISVRHGDTVTKTVVLTCVVGNYRATTAGGEAIPITETYWRVFNPSASPQYVQNGAAQKYSGGWWNPGGHNVWVKLDDQVLFPEDPDDASIAPVGVAPGDRITIVCPGIVATASADQNVSVSNPANNLARTMTIRNQLLTADRAIDLCKLYAAQFATAPTVVRAESELFTPYQPLDAMALTSARLNLSGLTGFLVDVAHELQGQPHSRFSLIQWAAIAAPSAQALPAPTLPPYEPDGSGASFALQPLWEYAAFDAIYSSVEISDGDDDGNEELYFTGWDGRIRALNANGTQWWLYNPGGTPNHAYGWVCMADVNGDGKLEVIWGSHDGTIRCQAYNGASILWSVSDYYTRTATALPDDSKKIFQHGGVAAMRDVSGTPTLCIFVAGFDGRLLCLRASNGTILWQANLNRDNPPWSGPGDAPAMLEAQPAIADIDGDGQPELLIPGHNTMQRFEHTGQTATNSPPPDTPTWLAQFDTDAEAAAIADIDGDGFKEIIFYAGTVVSGQVQHRLYVYDRNGNARGHYVISNPSQGRPVVHDIDRDGTKEIIVATDGGRVFCLRWQGGGLALVWERQTTATEIVSTPCVLDVDGDGWREVLAAGYDGRLVVLNGQTGAVKQVVDLPDGSGVEGTITGGDIDGDGYVEVLVPLIDSSRVACYRGGPTYPENWYRRHGITAERTGELVGN